MDLSEIAGLVGTGVATFAATWAGLVRPLKARSIDPAELHAVSARLDEIRKDVGKLKGGVARHDEVGKAHEKTAESAMRRVERIEERLAKTVTDEEFGAYTQQTTTAINGLTERVGRAIGALDALRS